MEALGAYQCRLCMAHDSFQLNIFREDLHHKHILAKLQTCLPVKVEYGDGLPSSICYKCLTQLEQSFEFWNKSFNSEAIFRHNLARGRNPPTLPNVPSLTGSAISNASYKSFDHETYFIEATEHISSDPQGSDDAIFSESSKLKENITLMCDKQSYSGHLEKPKRKCTRMISLSKDYPSNSNTVHLEKTTEEMIEDNCERRTYPAKNQQRLRDSELEAVKKLHKGKKDHFGGAGTMWMDNEELSNDESNVNNKYIDKNLFGDDVLKMYGNLKWSLGNSKEKSDLSTRSGEKCNSERKNKTQFSWEKTCKKCSEDPSDSSEIEGSKDNYTKIKRTTPKTKETLNIEGLQFDPNHCPKCNTTLTPSQNLLAHFQSHIEDD
ncbi:uncharacterized protein LOC124169318 [Ischnura elegans]|uniref:uncharacterized protein LOC124169318 n=1 Tax=Ischnura elegans TaxID=197161 RepID=UPI001ED87F2C|nr:uncharacterized protein LOC124169318 [Ischnura elegans]XP_046403857.1 uncharacterized protein LOC124169318 [Ischnura elegans]XP_046403858.1 uncharacterized protein LOC124169318 [Ischnura elegans]